MDKIDGYLYVLAKFYLVLKFIFSILVLVWDRNKDPLKNDIEKRKHLVVTIPTIKMTKIYIEGFHSIKRVV